MAWLYLLLGHGRFWSAGPVLASQGSAPAPAVDVVVPARDEAASIAGCLRSLLAQDYRGTLRVFLVDDRSGDGTGGIARAIADPRLTVIDGAPRPAGWSGKLWAVSQGVALTDAPYVFLCDADIVHDPAHLATLVAKAERDGLDMVSEMVALNCASWAERALVPAFVFFFQLLYPFARVNDPLNATAAAAGGTVLVRRRALDRIGGIAAVRGKLIDDVALATAVKRGGRIWLGHSQLARSVRPYPGGGRRVAHGGADRLRATAILAAGAGRDHRRAGAGLAGARRRRAVRPRPGALARHRDLGRRRRQLPADAAPLPPVAAVGGGAAGGGGVLHGGHDRLRPGPSPRPWRGLEAARLRWGRAVMQSVELPSGKGAGDENFPVGSRLISPALRPHVHAFYDFARNADDIADSATLAPDDKLARLDRMGAVLTGAAADGSPSATALRASLEQTGVTPQHSLDLLQAFRQDAVKQRYASWDELLDYCRYSADAGRAPRAGPAWRGPGHVRAVRRAVRRRCRC